MAWRRDTALVVQVLRPVAAAAASGVGACSCAAALAAVRDAKEVLDYGAWLLLAVPQQGPHAASR